MALFLSTYRNKVDKKGRVSVPAHFRAVVANQNFQGVVACPSFIYECIEASGMERFEQLSESIDHLDPYSEERNALATAILGSAVQLSFDADGRILLPEALVSMADLSDQAVFVGKGQTFEIWSPEKYDTHIAHARELAKQHRSALSLHPRGRVPGGTTNGGA